MYGISNVVAQRSRVRGSGGEDARFRDAGKAKERFPDAEGGKIAKTG